jgi:hypothetical protein
MRRVLMRWPATPPFCPPDRPSPPCRARLPRSAAVPRHISIDPFTAKQRELAYISPETPSVGRARTLPLAERRRHHCCCQSRAPALALCHRQTTPLAPPPCHPRALALTYWLAPPVSSPEFALQRPQPPANVELAHRSRPGLQLWCKLRPR